MKISPRTADTLSGWAEDYYNADVPYHNWGHAEEVMEESAQLLNENGRWTRHVNRPLLQIAAAWHDAGHDHDERHDFVSPEHYSAHLMRQRLRGQLPERQLADAEEMILGTRFMAARGTMASIALHYGDVGNMAHEFPSFYDHTRRLWAEYGKPEWPIFLANARHVIATTQQESLYELPKIGIDDGQYSMAIVHNLNAMVSLEKPNA